MQEPISSRPAFREKTWGGSRLHSVSGFDVLNDKIGEDWVISAYPHGVSVVEDGELRGKRLDELWSGHKKLLSHPSEPVFPLLIKILDAENDLSVRVHSNDAYGMKHESGLGKTECWYIVDAEPGAEIIYGHHAEAREELAEIIRDGRWDSLLERVPAKKGDFFYVPGGAIHAVGKGIIILGTQQSSDTTYRVYDHSRKSAQGQTRELHIQQPVDVITVPARVPELQIKEARKGNSSIITYLETEFFNVYGWGIKGITSSKKQTPYTLTTTIEGAGDLVVDRETYPLEGEASCVIPNDIPEWAIRDELAIIASGPGK